MPKLSELRAAIVGCLCVLLFATNALAQDVISRDLYEDRLRNDGNKITFCYNNAGILADFDKALAQAIGDALLAEVSFFTVKEGDLRGTVPRLDYRIPLSEQQIFYMMAEYCDAFMGFIVTDRNPGWLMVSRPYMSLDPILVTTNPDIETAADLPADARIGTRMMSSGDVELISFIAAGGIAAEWTRVPYYDPMMAIERMLAGKNDAAMIWGQGLYHFADGDLESKGLYRVSPLPFPVRAREIGVATRTRDGYLNSLLGDAIEALLADGTVDALLREHALAPPEGG